MANDAAKVLDRPGRREKAVLEDIEHEHQRVVVQLALEVRKAERLDARFRPLHHVVYGDAA